MYVAGGDPADPLEDLLGDGRVEQRLAASDRLEGRDEIARADLLQEVARAPATIADRTASSSGYDVSITTRVSGQLGADLAAGLDARAVRQPHVHDDDVRLERRACSMASADGAGLGHDLEAVAAVEQRDQALADDLVVVDDEQPQRSSGGRCVRLGHVRWLSVS